LITESSRDTVPRYVPSFTPRVAGALLGNRLGDVAAAHLGSCCSLAGPLGFELYLLVRCWRWRIMVVGGRRGRGPGGSLLQMVCWAKAKDDGPAFAEPEPEPEPKPTDRAARPRGSLAETPPGEVGEAGEPDPHSQLKAALRVLKDECGLGPIGAQKYASALRLLAIYAESAKETKRSAPGMTVRPVLLHMGPVSVHRVQLNRSTLARYSWLT
jgi:hypothetical protein